jgi:hypothetical protein
VELLRFRLATEIDLPTCRELLHPGFQLHAAARRHLVRLWSDMCRGNAMFSVIEDAARPHPEGIEAFGASVFVTDAFAQEFTDNPTPYVAALVYERLLTGRSPVLSPAQIRAANSSTGLNLVVLHFGLRDHDLANARTQAALQVGSAAFYFGHAGYQLKLLINEVYGAQHANYMKAAGVPLRTDFGNDSNPSLVHVPKAHRPFLFVQRREEIIPNAINPNSLLFHSPRPQLGFSELEQRVLLRGLLSESDVQIAAGLGVTLDTVKKTWRRAYDRVARVAPYLPGVSREQPTADRRGTEKRRHLLEYVRTHLEELRPHHKSVAVRG